MNINFIEDRILLSGGIEVVVTAEWIAPNGVPHHATSRCKPADVASLKANMRGQIENCQRDSALKDGYSDAHLARPHHTKKLIKTLNWLAGNGAIATPSSSQPDVPE